MCDLYIWLSYRFPEQFFDRAVVEQERAECGSFIALVGEGGERERAECGSFIALVGEGGEGGGGEEARVRVLHRPGG